MLPVVLSEPVVVLLLAAPVVCALVEPVVAVVPVVPVVPVVKIGMSMHEY